ncbi:sensor histidine kinase [Mucilaginibacter angelicae]|uniref:Sensor histidine kinase n=1 Tax=Mucilaginibacter angelicae TaxID=869718 RepID=A0ABV6L7E6_9SPHI
MSFLDRLLDLHRKHRWLSHAAFWLGYLLVAVSASKYRDGRQGTYGFEFTSDALYMLAEMIAAYGLAYGVVPLFFFRKRYVLAVIALLANCYLACVTGRIFIVKICEPLACVKPKSFETYGEILTDLPKLLYVYLFDMLAAAAIFTFVKVAKDQSETQKRAVELEKQKAEAELKLLKAQLHPHFLFNTLNNIYSLSLSNSPVTSGSIAHLSEMLDYILYQCNGKYVPVSGEITLLKNYISLEKLRYDERLRVNFKIDQQHDILIAPLILLSIVENAFKHGAGNDTGSPVIDIELFAEVDRFTFKVANTYYSKPEIEHSERIGLPNLTKQLDLIYPVRHTLRIAQNENTFVVELYIDLT